MCSRRAQSYIWRCAAGIVLAFRMASGMVGVYTGFASLRIKVERSQMASASGTFSFVRSARVTGQFLGAKASCVLLVFEVCCSTLKALIMVSQGLASLEEAWPALLCSCGLTIEALVVWLTTQFSAELVISSRMAAA